MESLFLELTLVVSLGIIVYLMAVAVPRIGEEENIDSQPKRAVLPLDQLDEFLLKMKDKFLRRIKILVMKIDNLISRQLKHKKE